jgi:RNA polymerase sigma-70 factor, ECF subfamily
VVYEAALKAWPRFEHQGRPVLAWLYTIAGRRVADFYRRRGVLAARAEEAGDQPELHTALGQLGESDRLAIDLHFFAGLSHQEAAQVLGITPNAATVRVHRALKRLGKAMGVTLHA